MANLKSNDTRLSRVMPFGMGQVKPHHFREMAAVVWENKTELRYAWDILRRGVCDGCSLGPYGLRDDVMEGIHLCMSRLKLLQLNTMRELKASALGDANRLQHVGQERLRSLGRLPFPFVRRKGDKGFTRVSWEEAAGLAAQAIRSSAPQRMGFFTTSRGLTNEVYYVFQKLARTLGTNNVDLCSRLCHAASVYGLKATLGVAAPTCSLADFIGTDLLVIFGSDLANNQPVTTKYMYYAKKKGTRILVVNPMREYGLERYWIPSVLPSALFGTKLMDDFFQVRVGGDIAFINGVLKALIAMNRLDKEFVAGRTRGHEELEAALDQQPWEMLEERSGLPRLEMERFAQIYGLARTAVFVYSMGLTQHEFGVDNVKAIVNLALARGMLGREKCGIMPIRGHSGVQGGGECGSEPDRFPGSFQVNEENARRFSNLWRHPLTSTPGLRVPEMIEAAHKGEMELLYSIGGNLLETMPDRRFVASALAQVEVRIHQDIVLNSSMLIDPAGLVILLPAETRYEQRSGGTTTSTERRIRFTPEIPGHRIGETRPEWEIPCLIGRKAMPNGDRLFPYQDTQGIREEMSRVMPMYQGVEKLTKEGDSLQWGGPYLFKGGNFPAMPEGRALFSALAPPDRRAAEGRFCLTTRRGKQFNSMTFGSTDRLMGSKTREAIFISPEDAERLSLDDGDRVLVRSQVGEMAGTIQIAPVKPGTLQAYWPEANVLIGRRTDPLSGEPDYNAEVELEKISR
ncbi:MAG: formate dehydrogenase [Deltaproteobacteria bacterium RIFCSPHIGHO2_02_FULL_60_17]|nr:MAG: formate dehydrogenase [Deltaproteobacteria bacterium RIFCSPHIGHO2_02_FULL_60_17]